METALILCQFLKFALAMLLCGAGGLQARSFSSGLMHASRQRAVQLVWLGALLNLLAGLTVPTLVVVGALDEPYVALARSMQQALPDARLTVVAESGHAVHLERSVAFADAVLEFLAGVPSVGTRWP